MGVTEMLFVVVLDDDVAEVDPDPQSDPAVLGRAASRSIIARVLRTRSDNVLE